MTKNHGNNPADACFVRQASLEDESAIARFLTEAYGERAQFKYPARWKWQFCDNPFLSEFPGLPIWIAVWNDRIVGQTCAQIEPLRVGDRKTLVGWSVDTVVLPEFRGLGLGKRLQKANQDSHPVFMSLSMSSANRGIKESLGGTRLPDVDVMDLLIGMSRDRVLKRFERISPLLKHVGRFTLADRVAASLVNLRKRCEWQSARHEWSDFNQNVTVHPVKEFDERIDAFWQRRRTDIGIGVERTSAYLNWRYVQQPHSSHQCYIALSGEKLCGYFVIRETSPPEPAMAILLDALGENRQLTSQLFVRAVDIAFKRGYQLVRAATSDNVLRDQFLRIGFVPRRQLTPMWFSHGFSIPDPANVHLGYGDHDLDQYPLAKT